MNYRRSILSAVLIALFATACSTTQPTAQVNSPCKDQQYLELKQKKLSELSEREYEYMKEKEKACDEYNRTAMQMQQTKEISDDARSSWLTWYLVAAGIGLVGSLIVISTI